MKHRRHGFTLIEMTVVIGIILILVSMAVIGFNQLARGAAGRSTHVTLGNLQGMLAEYSATAGGIDSLPGPPYAGGVGGPISGITDVNPDASGRYNAQPVIDTYKVMAALMKVPAIRDMVLKLPPKQILKDSAGNAYAPPGVSGGAVLVDGFNNPIIFVPNGGINVWINGQTTPFLVKSPDNHPFFASAGQDGDFGADATATLPLPSSRTAHADDNIYSFESKQ